MKTIKIILSIFLSFAVLFSVISCNGKSQETNLKKAQSIYDKKGLLGFEKYLENNSYVPVRDSSQGGATPFLISIKNNDFEEAKYFIEKGALLTEKDNNGNNCIDYVLETENKEIIAALFPLIPNDFWNVKDEEGCLPCVKFIKRCKDFSLTEDVLNLTGNLSACDNKGKSLLMYASQNNTDVRVTKFILDKDSTLLDLKNENEWSALMYAARYNPNPAVIEGLLLRGANTTRNSVGLTITMLASCNQNPGVLFTLLKYKNEINEKTMQGKTALMYACENQQDSSIIKMLIDNGADVNEIDNNGKSSLLYALEHYSKPEVVYVLISAGVKTNISDNNGKSALDYLTENKNLKSTDLRNALDVSKKLSELSVESETENKVSLETADKDESEVDNKESLETPNEDEAKTDDTDPNEILVTSKNSNDTTFSDEPDTLN